jgi:hypothetical protein
MAAKTTLNAKNLEALGTQRLAELLIEISTGSAAHKQRLRIELAGNDGSAEMARAVRKRLVSIARARTVINWRRVKKVKADLETQRKAIVDIVAADDPREGFELIWQFMALGDSIFERSDDNSGLLMESFRHARADAGVIAKAAGIDARVLADRIFAAVQGNAYGQYDELITAMVAALGNDGLEHLKALFAEWSNEPQVKPAAGERRLIGQGSDGPIYEDEIYEKRRELIVHAALQEIADAQGDVDAYIALQPERTRKFSVVAADMASRLLRAGRADEALQTLDGADINGRDENPVKWQLARVETLEALGRPDDAQADRWKWFQQSLNELHLRALLKRLPDFDDIEAEEKAFAHAQAFPDVHGALTFFLNWPALAEAAKLVVKRKAELDGDLYELMTWAAETLADKHPLAATIVLRSMIDFALDSGRSSRYRHAARHLAECASLASDIVDFAGAESHDAYVARLKRQHGKRPGFWG